ncbi:protein quiver-like [Chrysoperla carnea]|uniref:protein quiver-like n=1 Tax=Chrysoperla carnea TaxID=189513 RepID=UPI001D090EC2|nr:protein quiver-like [Chrysoperla carnea]
MENSMKILLGVVFLSCFAIQNSIGYSIKCWECNSDFDPKCGDPFDNSTIPITDCAQRKPNLDYDPVVNSHSCEKKIQTDIITGKRSVVRSCGYQSPSVAFGKCKEPEQNSKIRIEFCELCSDKDGCNSAPSLLSRNSFTHLLAFSFAAIIGNFILF